MDTLASSWSLSLADFFSLGALPAVDADNKKDIIAKVEVFIFDHGHSLVTNKV